MPKLITLPDDEYMNRHAGIEIRFTPSARRLDISGYYDSCVGIQGTTMTLEDFFERLGITEEHCRKAFAALKSFER